MLPGRTTLEGVLVSKANFDTSGILKRTISVGTRIFNVEVHRMDLSRILEDPPKRIGANRFGRTIIILDVVKDVYNLGASALIGIFVGLDIAQKRI